MKAKSKGAQLRLKTGSSGRVDAEEVANLVGCRVDLIDLPGTNLFEVTLEDSIAVSTRLCDAEKRWSIAHAIGHRVMHPGNQLWLRAKTMLANKDEREAEDFAYGLLIDEAEAMDQGLSSVGEFAEYFGVPPEMVRFQERLC